MEMIDFKESNVQFDDGKKSYEFNILNKDESSCLAFTLPSDDTTHISFELLTKNRKKLYKYVSVKTFTCDFIAKEEIINILNQFIDNDNRIRLKKLRSYLSAHDYNVIPINIT
ncbi:TPA: hypothetical protein ACSPFM_002502 [Enterococcus faecium]